MTERYELTLTRRELRLIRQAIELGRDQTVNPLWRWWHETKSADALYQRVLELWRLAR